MTSFTIPEECTFRATNEYGRSILCYDEGSGGDPLWVYGKEYGPIMIIRARSFETAYEIAMDESPTIPQDEVPEAYGFDGWCSGGYDRTEKVYSPETALERFNSAIAAADRGEREYPELLEGYQCQSNFTGTGIVHTGHYEWLEEFTPEQAERFRLTVEIVPWEE